MLFSISMIMALPWLSAASRRNSMPFEALAARMHNRLATQVTTINDLHQITDRWECLAGRAHPHIRLGRHVKISKHVRNTAIGLALQTISGSLVCCLLCEKAKKLIGMAARSPYA